MHWQAFSFVQYIKNVFPSYFIKSRVVEFGSIAVNYSISELFDFSEDYFGVDLKEGKNVNVVANARDVNLGNGFDIAISCECFEHNPYYLETFKNMVSHVRDGGLVVFTCATTGREEHGTSRTSPEQSPGTYHVGWDYYKNLEASDFPEDLLKCFSSYSFFTNTDSCDLYFVGFKSKGELTDEVIDDIKRYLLNSGEIGKVFEDIWLGKPSQELVNKCVALLYEMRGGHLNPYILENVFPILIRNSGEENIKELDEISLDLTSTFYENPISHYLRALYGDQSKKAAVAIFHSIKSINLKPMPESLWLFVKTHIHNKTHKKAINIVEDNIDTLERSSQSWVNEEIFKYCLSINTDNGKQVEKLLVKLVNKLEISSDLLSAAQARFPNNKNFR